MASYPNTIKEFRTVGNLPGIVYDPTQSQTVFAEDTTNANDEIVAIETTLGVNPQGDFPTVADRLAAGGGGGGAWELIHDITSDGSSSILNVTGLNLISDYMYKFSMTCPLPPDVVNFICNTTYSSELTLQSFVNTGSALTAPGGFTWIAHPSLGYGCVNGTLTCVDNRTPALDMTVQVANSRKYDVYGFDSGWYSGTKNVTSIGMVVSGSNNLPAGARILVWRVLL